MSTKCFLTVNDFIALTGKLTERQMILLTGALVLGKMNKKRGKKDERSKRTTKTNNGKSNKNIR